MIHVPLPAGSSHACSSAAFAAAYAAAHAAQPTPRSPRRAAHAEAYQGPCAALPVVMGCRCSYHLRTCAPACHLRTSAQWPLPTSMPLPMLASEAPTLTLVRA